MNLVKRYSFKKQDDFKLIIRGVMLQFLLDKSDKAKPKAINISVS